MSTPSLCSARRSSPKLDRSGPASSSLSTCASHMLAASAGGMGCKLQCVGRVLNGSPHRPEDVPLLGRQRTPACQDIGQRSEEHTSELQSLMRISSAVCCLKNTNTPTNKHRN